MDVTANILGLTPVITGRNAVVSTAFENLYSFDQPLSWPAIFSAAFQLDITSSNAADAYFVSKGTVTDTKAAPGVFTLSTHTLVTGQHVKITTTGALYTGLVAGQTYYACVIDANTFTLCPTRADAIAGTNKIATTGTESGTHTLFIPGTGTNKIVVAGLDANYKPLVEEIVMTGTTKVVSTNSFLRVFAAEATETGTGLVNAGDIYVIKKDSSAAYTTAGIPDTITSGAVKILTGYGFAASGMYTVPAGFRARLKGAVLSCRAYAHTFRICTQKPADYTDNALHCCLTAEVNASNFFALSAKDLGIEVLFEEKTDIVMQALSATAGGIASGTLSLEIFK